MIKQVNIPGFTFTDMVTIDKGVSGDKKYRVVTSDGQILLLRISNIESMVPNSLDISVIDWDLFDDNIYGDPWSEFSKILNADVSPKYTTGLLRGYFEGEPPEEFWRILAVYLTSGAMMLVTWAVFREPSFLDSCIQTASDVLLWYDGMERQIPTWYLQECCEYK